MQTTVIGYRVADFLKNYPPFQAMEESDLLKLAAHGRVKFHESDEYVFWQGTSHAPFIYVIQQGTVSLWEDTGDRERLRDIRGPGDMLGIERFLGAGSYLHSAKTNSDVVVYAFDAGDFAPMLEKYQQVSRYVASHASVSTDYQPQDQRRGAHQLYVYDAVRRREPPTCAEGDSVREATRKMTAAGSQAIAVVDGQRRVTGVVTSDGILRWIGEPGNDPDGAVTRIMIGTPCVIAPEAVVSHCVLTMAEAGADVVVATRDGTTGGELHGPITPSELAPAFGDQPLAILRDIACAPDIASLRTLQFSTRTFLLEQLAAPSSLDWLARFAHRADAAIVNRIAQLAEMPNGEFCLCFYGASGRQEALTAVTPQVAVLLGEECATEHFNDWSRSIEAALAGCGYLAPPGLAIEVAPLDEWKARFRGWVRQPVLNDINTARPLFDLHPVHGHEGLWAELQNVVRDEVLAETSFVRIMAHDCLSNLPPLTIFRDLVVEGTGGHTSVFHLERNALRPLVDVARVFGIAAGGVSGSSSLARFFTARAMLPDHEAVFREAADTLRVVLYHQARAGIRAGGDGSELPPSLLSGHDRQALKSGFPSILRLLEFTAECRWLDTR